MSGVPSVVVFTANSNTGTAVISSLLYDHEVAVNIIAVVRTGKAAREIEESFPEEAVTVVTGDIKKSQMLSFLDGVNTAYWAVPATTDRTDLTKRFIDACFEHGVEYPVIISVLCADQRATKIQKQFADIEDYAMSRAGQRVHVPAGDKGLNVFRPTFVRSAPFFQNFYASLRFIAKGTLFSPLGGVNDTICQVDYTDVARVVAKIMTNPSEFSDASGKIYNCVSQYQSGADIASAFTRKVGGGMVKYEDVPDAVAIQAFVALKIQPWIATGMVETLRWFQSGSGDGVVDDTERVTGTKSKKFDAWVGDSLKAILKEQIRT